MIARVIRVKILARRKNAGTPGRSRFPTSVSRMQRSVARSVKVRREIPISVHLSPIGRFRATTLFSNPAICYTRVTVVDTR